LKNSAKRGNEDLKDVDANQNCGSATPRSGSYLREKHAAQDN